MVGITLKHAISPTNKIANTRQEQLITQYVIRLQLTPVAHLAAKTSDENTADKQTAAKQMQTKCGKSGKVVDDDFFHQITRNWHVMNLQEKLYYMCGCWHLEEKFLHNGTEAAQMKVS